MAAKCANRHIIEERSRVLQPRQVGVGVAGGAEVAVHAMRRYMKLIPVEHPIIKLDFTNAFDSIHRDLLLDTMARNMPELDDVSLSSDVSTLEKDINTIIEA